jgi:GNAT superfamily N-acetyltransferase
MNRNEKILFVKQQLSEIWKCGTNVFDSDKNIFIETQDTFFQMVTFGKNAVIRGNKKIIEWFSEKFSSTPACFIMDSDNFYFINEKLRSFGKKLGDENIRYLHLFPERTPQKPLGFTYKLYNQDNIKELYEYKEFSENALTRTDKDMLAVAAYYENIPVAVAGCDSYWEELWQIGIDTIPEYRQRGLAVYLVKELSFEIERNGKNSWYQTWSANIASTRVALNAGFYPVWVNYSCNDL